MWNRVVLADRVNHDIFITLLSPLSSLPSPPPSSPQVVNERLLCHAIIGRNPHKERIMVVDVSARFIAPLLEFSTQEMCFTIQQVRLTVRECALHETNSLC